MVTGPPQSNKTLECPHSSALAHKYLFVEFCCRVALPHRRPLWCVASSPVGVPHATYWAEMLRLPGTLFCTSQFQSAHSSSRHASGGRASQTAASFIRGRCL